MEQEEPDTNTTTPVKEDENNTNQIEQQNDNDVKEKTDVQNKKTSSTKLLTTIFIGLLGVFGIAFLWFLLKKR